MDPFLDAGPLREKFCGLAAQLQQEHDRALYECVRLQAENALLRRQISPTEAGLERPLDLSRCSSRISRQSPCPSGMTGTSREVALTLPENWTSAPWCTVGGPALSISTPQRPQGPLLFEDVPEPPRRPRKQRRSRRSGTQRVPLQELAESATADSINISPQISPRGSRQFPTLTATLGAAAPPIRTDSYIMEAQMTGNTASNTTPGSAKEDLRKLHQSNSIHSSNHGKDGDGENGFDENQAGLPAVLQGGGLKTGEKSRPSVTSAGTNGNASAADATAGYERSFDMHNLFNGLQAAKGDPNSKQRAFGAENSEKKEMRERLREWFDEIATGGFITCKEIQDMVMIATNGQQRLSTRRIKEIIQAAPSAADLMMTQISSDSSVVRRKTTGHVGKSCNMTREIYADLVFWQEMNLADDENLIMDALLLREAMVRMHVEKVVEEHAHLQCPNRIARLKTMETFDIIVALVIVINGIVIGVEADHEDWEGFKTLEMIFTTFFVLEICVKLCNQGISGYFCGKEMNWNYLDLIIVSCAVVDVIMNLMNKSSFNFDIIKLARLIRITRLLRLLRLLRMRIFKELTLMITGVIAGLRTLFWAIVLLFCIIYALAVVLRQTVGEESPYLVASDTPLFTSIQWSMFFIFRACMADEALPDGTPISGHLYEQYGLIYVFPYTLCKVFITFGVFNLITAIFVENVMDAARERQNLSKVEERERVAKRVADLVMLIIYDKPRRMRQRKSSRFNTSLASNDSSFKLNGITMADLDIGTLNIFEEFGRDEFLYKIEDPAIVATLEDLDINVSDNTELFDMLDGDGSGIIDVGEFVQGIMKMRSGEVKNDMVAAVLGIRGLQKTCRDLAHTATRNHVALLEARTAVDELVRTGTMGTVNSRRPSVAAGTMGSRRPSVTGLEGSDSNRPSMVGLQPSDPNVSGPPARREESL